MVRALRPPPPNPFPTRPERHRRGKGRRYVPDVVERVRVLIVGTTLPEAEIARRVRVGVGTVHGWKLRRGWQRPPGTSISTRKVGLSQAGFTRRCREVLRRLEDAALDIVIGQCGRVDADRDVLHSAVALVLKTRASLRLATSPPRRAMRLLQTLASAEAGRLAAMDAADTGLRDRVRALADVARQSLYRSGGQFPC